MTISSVAISGDVAVTSTTGTSGFGAKVSWVVKNDDIFICIAGDWDIGVARCIKAKEEESK